jgi:phosphate transport system protein
VLTLRYPVPPSPADSMHMKGGHGSEKPADEGSPTAVIGKRVDELESNLGQICGFVEVGIRQASSALINADTELAEVALTAYEQVAAMAAAAEKEAVTLMSGETSVTSDVRRTLCHAADLERMGEAVSHIANVAQRHPTSALPAEGIHDLDAMGHLAVTLAGRTHHVLLSGDHCKAAQLREDSDTMDGLHRRLFVTLLKPDWPWSRASTQAADLTWLGRFYGRFADHAVAIANRATVQTAGSPSL